MPPHNLVLYFVFLRTGLSPNHVMGKVILLLLEGGIAIKKMAEGGTSVKSKWHSALIHIEILLLIGIGGFVGANLRYFLAILYPNLIDTFLANTLGSFFLGFILYEAIYTGILSEKSRVVVATGLLSSFTTYSTFAFQTLQTSPALGVVNVLANYGFGFGGVLLGSYLASLIEVE